MYQEGSRSDVVRLGDFWWPPALLGERRNSVAGRACPRLDRGSSSAARRNEGVAYGSNQE